MKALNWNSKVKVKLTAHGVDIYYHRDDHITDKNGRRMLKPRLPVVDENGFCTFQLWDFMQTFGKYIGMGLPHIVETINFFIEEEDIDDVDERGDYIRADQPQA